MGEYSEAFVAFDTAKVKHAVAIADGGHGGEVRFVGDVASLPATVERLVRKLAGRYFKLHFCYEARSDRLRPLPTAVRAGTRLRGGRPVADPEEAGRAGQDQPTRRGDPGAAAARRRTDL